MFIRGFMSLLLCLAIVFTLPFAVFAEDNVKAVAANGEEIQISGINKPIQVADEIILYTRENLSELTDTNPWCAAAIADYKDGKYTIVDIKDKAGAVAIPFNGFVLFGHGKSEEWILNNLKAGEEIVVNGYTLPKVISGPNIGLEDGSWHPVDGINAAAGDNKLIVYTSEYGQWTSAFNTDTVQAVISNNVVVEKNYNGVNGSYIPSNGFVLSGTGDKKQLVEGLAAGDKISVANISIPALPEKYFKVGDITVPIDKVNGDRGANQVVLYTPEYGKSTGTNAWGTEITVVDGIVTNVVGIRYDGSSYLDNNSPIPSNGVVLSVQAGSPYHAKLDGRVKAGDAIQVVTDNTSMYNAAKTTYDALNPKTREDNPAGWDDVSNTPFPGFRGADQLIIYDISYGSNTGTNPWGFEVIVNSEGKIIKTGGNSSDIPAGGYVLSGHGIKNEWLTKNALVGATVRIDQVRKEVFILFKPESYAERGRLKIAYEEDNLAASKQKYLDVNYDAIQGFINTAKLYQKDVEAKLAERNYGEMLKALEKVEKEIANAYLSNFESRKVETRAIWLRPKETNVEKVVANLDKLKALNINTVYLETWWDGFTIYPTRNTVTEQNPMYNGFDVFKAYIEEAHKRGMEVHAWVEDFNVGNASNPVFKKKPEWMSITRKGDRFDFANPALSEVRDFVIDIYKEIVQKYDVDGLQLDYIRFPEVQDGSNDCGYDEYTKGLFIAKYGIDPVVITPDHEMWATWCKFRAEFINTFVYRVFNEIKAIKKEVEISADVWPQYNNGPTQMMQEPKDWVSKGYIDNIIPMAYNLDSSATATDTKNTNAFADNIAFVTIGTAAPYDGLSQEEMVRQINAANRTMADGTASFEFETLMGGEYGDKLLLGIYSNKAIFPDNDPVLSVGTILNDILRKINEIYVPYNGMDESTALVYAGKINSVLKDNAFRNSNNFSADDLKKIKTRLSQIMDESKADTGINPEVVNRMAYDLNTCIRIIDKYTGRETFIEGHHVEKLVIEAPVSKVGDTAQLKVKAVFQEGDNVIMYLDPSQYKVETSNPNVLSVDGTEIKVKSKGKANIIVTVSNDFIYKINNAQTVVKQVVIN